MYLTSFEREMLDGKYGEGMALAMRVQVALGEAFDAERMVEISRAHVALSNQEADLWFVEKLLSAGAYCSVAPTVNPGFHLEYFLDRTDLTGRDMEMIRRTRKSYRQIGATLSFSCTPYLMENIPRQREIVAFSESSATPYVNAVWGARSNRESAQSALCASVTGRVPLYGLLLSENRLGNILVKVDVELSDEFDFRLLGYCAPKIGHGVPVFSGISWTGPEALMNLGAELNTAGAYGMYHVVGVTPEAPDQDVAFGRRTPLREVTITRRDLDEVRDSLSSAPGQIDFAMFGCPHLTLNQVRNIAGLVEGKQLKAEMWIMTSATTRELARRTGYLSIIEMAGGHIVEDTCIDQPCWRFLEGKVGVTDSLKGAYYARRRGMSFVFRSITQCVQAALKGEVE